MTMVSKTIILQTSFLRKTLQKKNYSVGFLHFEEISDIDEK